MSILQVEVVVGSVDVAGNDAGELAPVLAGVGLVEDVDHPLGHGVAVVRVVWGPVVDHGLVNRVGRLVGEDTGAEAGDDLLGAGHVSGVEDVVVHAHVVPEEVEASPHVGEESPDESGQVDDVGGLVLLEDGQGGGLVQQVSILGGDEDPLLVGALVLRHDLADPLSNHAGPAGNQDNL